MAKALQVEWLYAAVILAIIGAILITIIGIHSIYQEQRAKLGSKWSRALSVIFFISGWISCIAFGLFRTNLILPMGDKISCHFGFYLSSNGVFFAKIFMYCIFLYRIHLAFHSSSLGYKSSFLIIVLMIGIIASGIMNILHIILTLELVHFEHLTHHSTIGICTSAFTGTNEQRRKISIFLGCMFLGDALYSCFVCGLFLHKLRSVINMTNPENETHGHRRYNMILLSRKQAILVTFACLSSLLIFGLSAVIDEMAYVVSVDSAVNSFCIWFMYSFNKKKWRTFVKYVCCCCYCLAYKEEAIVSMHSFTERYSTKDKENVDIPPNSIQSVSNNDE
eukprot:350326_1